MQLTDHFSTEQFSISPTAKRLGINNNIPDKLLPYAMYTAQNMEVVMRVLGGNKLNITSCFRGPLLNKAVKGSKSSAHRWALAVDFVCPGFGNTRKVCEALINAGMKFDQLIMEFPESSTGGWVHIGFAVPKMRQQVLTATKRSGSTKYLQGLV